MNCQILIGVILAGFSIPICAQTEKIELLVYEREKGIHLSLLNVSDQAVQVRSGFFTNSTEFGAAEIFFEIIDHSGRQIILIDEGRRLLKNQTAVLMSGYSIGRYFSYNFLRANYGLSDGEYKVKAVYCNRCPKIDTVFSDRVESKEFPLIVGEGVQNSVSPKKR